MKNIWQASNKRNKRTQARGMTEDMQREEEAEVEELLETEIHASC